MLSKAVRAGKPKTWRINVGNLITSCTLDPALPNSTNIKRNYICYLLAT